MGMTSQSIRKISYNLYIKTSNYFRYFCEILIKEMIVYNIITVTNLSGKTLELELKTFVMYFPRLANPYFERRSVQQLFVTRNLASAKTKLILLQWQITGAKATL